MDLEQFESQTREAIEQVLNQLQTATLLTARLQTQISEAGRSVQSLSETIELFLAESRGQASDSEGAD
ncbi:hypothetical protein IFO70_18560 [Phormidium tenue FACHB-886]|nr:hypothetical protein [Phormidium tenue FACHB-886]